jgi:hypothetical protein
MEFTSHEWAAMVKYGVVGVVVLVVVARLLLRG